jgi:hypothetical protein
VNVKEVGRTVGPPVVREPEPVVVRFDILSWFLCV